MKPTVLEHRRPRVTFLITGIERGGAEKQLVSVAEGLAHRDWNVSVISMVRISDYRERLEASGVTAESLQIARGRPDPRGLWRLLRMLRRDRPRVLCTFMYHANVLGRVGGRMAGVPAIVSSMRNLRFGGPFAKRLMRWTDPFCTLTITNSQLTASFVVREGIVPKDKLQVIPNGIVLADYVCGPSDRLSVRAELGVREGDFLWLYLGRLERQKNLPILLEAFRQLMPQDRRAMLAIAGQGSLAAEIARRVRELGLEQRIRLLGLRRDVSALLGAADGFVLASLWEGLPNAIMEALAARLPVVATSVGGVPELIREGETGKLVPPQDPARLASALHAIMTMPEAEREHLTNRGHQHLSRLCSMDTIINSWDLCLREVMHRTTWTPHRSHQ